MRFSGKEKFTKFWISDSYSAMYEICSPEVPELAQRLARRSDTPLNATAAEETLYPLDFDGLTNPSDTPSPF